MKKVKPICVENNENTTKITLYACDLLSIIRNDISFNLGNGRELLFDKLTGDIVYFDDNDGSEVYLDEITFSAWQIKLFMIRL